jgi:hypothetical protein
MLLHRLYRILVAALTALAVGCPCLNAADAAKEATKDAAKDVKQVFTAEQAAALETLQRELARLDPMWEKIDDPQHKAWLKEKMDKLKERFRGLQKAAFDQTKYDELRFDVNIEYQRLAVWLREPLVPAKAKGK